MTENAPFPFHRPWLMPSVLVIFLFATFAYFHHVAAGWNVNSRLDLTYAVVEQGTFSIDAYHAQPLTETGDKALFQNHFYCDKSPALSFLAVPFYAALYYARDNWGIFQQLPQSTWIIISRYIIGLPTICLTGALFGLVLFWIGLYAGATRIQSFLLSSSILLGTFLFGYATLFYPYMPSLFCLAAGYYLLLRATPESGMRLFFAGLLVGLGWYFEYTAGLAGLGLSAYALWQARRKPLVIWKYIVAGLIPVVLLFSYTYVVFGEFSIPYKYEYREFFRGEMAKGFQGIHLPKIGILYYITIHPFKGLFFFSPFLLLWFAGIWRGLRNPLLRRYLPDILLSIYIVAAYFIFNSGYYLWWGGWAAGPRHLAPAIPFFLLPIALFVRTTRWPGKCLFGIVLAASIAMNFMITAVDPQVPTSPPDYPDSLLMAAPIGANIPSPILRITYPMFFKGDLALNIGLVVFHLPGLWSLIPLMALWLIVAIWLMKQRDAAATHSPPEDAPAP